MHQLAIALFKKGYTVTGSDDEIFEPSRTNLQQHGLLPPQEGWDENYIHGDLDAVLLGMHARADNPELVKARALGLPIYSFPEYIYQESKDKRRVVVGGSHGKTTTTGMIMHALQGNMTFDYLVGAKIPGFDQSVSITDAPILVAEGDEYPASAIERRPKFHFLFPHIAILTGIAWDHINVFPTWENYLEQFIIFLHKIEPGGYLIYNNTDEVLQQLVNDHLPAHINPIPYLPLPSRREGDKTIVSIEGEETPIAVFGEHNLLNMHAAWHACKLLGLSAASFAQRIASFTGAARRLEKLEVMEGITVYRDFAHAPSKVKATLKAMVAQAAPKPVVAVLELHTYSSLNKDFLPHYAHALDGAVAAAVFYSEHALSIKRLPMISEADIRIGFGRADLFVCNNKAALEDWLKQFNFQQHQLLLMSSGTFDGMAVQDVLVQE